MSRGEEQPFFEVFFNNDIWVELKKWMFPNKKSSNYHDYKDGDMAAKHGYLSLILENPNLKFSKKAINYASAAGHLEVVKYLIKNSETLKIQINDFTLFTACENGRLEIAEFYYSTIKVPLYSQDLNIIDFTAEGGYLKILKLLILNGAPKGSNSAIDWAAKGGYIQIIKYLYQQGYRCSKRALYYAASNGHLKVVEFLFEVGLTRTKGHIIRAAMFARRNQRCDILSFLLDRLDNF